MFLAGSHMIVKIMARPKVHHGAMRFVFGLFLSLQKYRPRRIKNASKKMPTMTSSEIEFSW